MLKLIHGEVYRLFHKKSMYLYFAILLIGYFLVAFVRSGGFDEESVLQDVMTLFNLLPALIGGFLFVAIYTDDLNAKNLITLVGYGLSKAKIVLAKFIIGAVFAAVAFALMPLFHCGVYALLGHAATTDQMTVIFIISLKFFLMTLAFFSFSSIVAYGVQRTTFAIVAYILFAFNIVGSLLVAATKMLSSKIAEYLLTGLTDKVLIGMISGDPVVLPILGCVVYIVVAMVLSVVAFHKKEMEF